MLKRLRPLIFIWAIFAEFAPAATAVKIISLSGDVKIRRGVEENWQHAAAGMWLEEIDTILAGEAANVTLELRDGAIFRLGSFAILDIADLRKMTERELFLYLMSQKVHQIPTRQEKTRLHIGNVSVVHGESKARAAQGKATKDEQQSGVQETNGAIALYDQHYYPNAIVKLHKVLAKYPDSKDCGERYYYLGKAFEALNNPGQAVEAYKISLEQLCDHPDSKQRAEEVRQAIARLK
jgi:tetratricopeptide (TPR) repeat protein